jgi:hypothetical protein
MPGSVPEGKDLSMYWIKNKINPQTVLDVGAGVGTYSLLFRKYDFVPKLLNAIEVWEPYIKEYELLNKYKNVFNVDVREWEDWNYDLVILGDVLEHMSKDEALTLWDKISKQARYAIISIPIIDCPQGHEHDNPYEEHIKDDWTTQEVLKSFTNIIDHNEYSVVGVFLAKF